jgi:hypothetical protein
MDNQLNVQRTTTRYDIPSNTALADQEGYEIVNPSKKSGHNHCPIVAHQRVDARDGMKYGRSSSTKNQIKV